MEPVPKHNSFEAVPHERIARALHCIFVGGLLCIFDVTHSSVRVSGGSISGWRFDFLSDTVGVLLIMWGLAVLGRLDFGDRYSRRIGFAQGMALLSLIQTIIAHWLFNKPPAWIITLQIVGLLRLAAIIGFCSAMVILASSLSLARPARSFAVTKVLFVLLYAIPLAVSYVIVLLNHVGSKVEFKVEGALAILILVVFTVPLIHFFVSTRRLRSELDVQQAMARAEWA